MKDFESVLDRKLPFYGVDNEWFKLGDSIYHAVEDESDGWRSLLGCIETANDKELIFFQTPVATVTAKALDDGYFDGYVLVDSDGHEWLRIGTDNYDDWYPCFTFTYTPRPTV